MNYLSFYSFSLYSVVLCLLINTTLKSQVYDVQQYDIKVDLFHSITEEDNYFTGEVKTTIRIDTAQTAQINFDSFGLQIDSVKIDSENVMFSIIPNKLIVNLNKTYFLNEEVTIDIFYAHPDSLGNYYGGYHLALPNEHLSQKVAFTNGLPNYTHYWFPCKEDLSDRALLDLTVAVPGPDYIAVSNGKLIDSFSVNDKLYYHWRDENTIKPAVIFIAASKYSVLNHTFVLNNSQNELQFFVWPVNGNFNFDSSVCFSKLVELLDYYSGIYTDFPFDNMKIAFALGIYSNQTVMSVDEETSLNRLSSLNNYGYFPHEIAHQWFGNYINAGSVRELWLNEGFAQYSSLLFADYISGNNQIHTILNSIVPQILSNDVSLVNDSLYHPIIYTKAPCVIDMLRYCLGDSLYWASISLLFQEYAFKSFLSADLLNVVETVTGEDYHWFFDQWVYNAGFPVYEIEYRIDHLMGEDYQVNIHVKQTQGTSNYFKMPLPFRIFSNFSDTTVTFLNDSWDQSFSLVIQGNPDSIKFDEENKILLKKVSSITGVIEEHQVLPVDFLVYQNYPNPFNPSTTIKFALPVASDVKIMVYNTLGQLVETLIDGEMQSGYHEINFDASRLASGVYLYHLRAGDYISVKKMLLLK